MQSRNPLALVLGLILAFLSVAAYAGAPKDWYYSYLTRDGRTAYSTDCAEVVNAIHRGCRAPDPDPVITSLTYYPQTHSCNYVVRPGCNNGNTWENGSLQQAYGCAGFSTLPDGSCDGPAPKKNLGACKNCATPSGVMVGNPINASTGNKFEAETDYRGQGPFPLVFTRYYNSAADTVLAPIGARWRHSHQRTITLAADGLSAEAARADGKVLRFALVNGAWTGDRDVSEKLTRLANGWRYANADDETETYDVNGKLIAIANRAGVTQTLAYDAAGRLSTVADAFGRALTFAYVGDSAVIAAMTDPAGGQTQ